MSPRAAVLFDAAGTLIELREPVGKSYARVARAFGVALPAQSLDAAFRAAFAAAPPMVFPGAPQAVIPTLEKAWWRRVVWETFERADPRAAFRDFDAFFAQLFEVMGRPRSWRAVRGAHALLRDLRSAGWSTAIVSNFDRRLPKILEGLSLAPLLDAVVLCSDVGAAKPAAAIFARALELLDVPASHAVFVGDDAAADIAGARAAGIRAIPVDSLATLAELPSRLPRFAGAPRATRGGSLLNG
ncbi:MAG TPA: HAD-IA family hydrolase [Myxococcota bacterium]|nr:HAD-IA family hydrolase [Myxococcota bacterium]